MKLGRVLLPFSLLPAVHFLAHAQPGSKDAARVISRKESAGYWEYLLDDAIFTAPPHTNFGGAALIDHQGKLVGIGSLFTQIPIAGLGAIPGNMFVPIDYLKPILYELIDKGQTSEPPRPWLGVNEVQQTFYHPPRPETACGRT